MVLNIMFLFFLLFLFIQACFFTFIFSKLAFFSVTSNQSHPPVPSSENLEVSIVIAAHNEFDNLQNLIPLLLRQKFPTFEIIVVDDRSTDRSQEFLKKIGKNIENFKVIIVKKVPSGWSPKKHALTAGIEAARFGIILLTDADCLPVSDEWIKNMTFSFLNKNIEACLGYSPYTRRPGFLNLLIRFETFYTAIQYLSIALAGFPYMGVGRNLAYTRNLFLKNRGFENHKKILGGDDDLFGNQAFHKINTAIVVHKESQTVSKPKTSYNSWVRQKTRHLSVGFKYKRHIKWILGLLMCSHFGFYLTALLICLKGELLGFIINGYIFRSLLMIFFYHLIARKVKEDFQWYVYPVLDFIYLMNFILVSVKTIFAKKIKWT